jgi:hypothetical protein
MNRFITYQNNESIQYAHSIIPASILERLNFDYLVGYDPVYAGLFDNEICEDGRSYRNTACVAYPFHQLIHNGKTTIVLPGYLPYYHIVHEIGHVLDEYLNFEHKTIPVTEYAKTNRQESFAEAFTAWLFYGYAQFNLRTQSGIDDNTESLFLSLTRR